ncbi:MAG TPA: hypothetical protein VHU44_16665 [Acidobacteriaceae bacterium]|jgi:uncharacterized protein (TIGR03435 family)|nr:hypothetical protein [Acidobacteriaceae bacterium]
MREPPQRHVPGAEPDANAATTPAGDSISTVLQEQLGQKLTPGAEVPVEFLVVGHIEKPTEN